MLILPGYPAGSASLSWTPVPAIAAPVPESFRRLHYLSVNHSTPVFRRKHDMVEQHRYVMTLVDILTDKQLLRRKRRGIKPSWD